MSIALFAFPGIWAPVRGLIGRFGIGSNPTQRRSIHPALSRDQQSREFATDSTVSKTRQPLPLRVVRVVEVGQMPTQVGRMVISGRMADVCAELDRLVACSGSGA
jgi:hypothetical protein